MEPESDYLPMDFLVQVADVIKVLGHPHRLRIVDVLEREGELPVGRVGELCELPQSQTSQHLSQMRRLGIVAGRREGNQVFYQLDGVQPHTIIKCLRERYVELNAPATASLSAAGRAEKKRKRPAAR